MNPSKKRILFFTPYATRTGSEMILLNILKCIQRDRFEVAVVTFSNGELLKEFPPDIKIYIAPRKFKLYQKILYYLGINPTILYLRKLARDFHADMWYVNTVMIPETIVVAKEFSIPVVTHFHELPGTYSYLSGPDFKSIIDNSKLLIGCSKITCEAIRNAGGKRISLLYEFVDHTKVIADNAKAITMRRKLGIPDGAYVWVCSGMTSERKGFDLLPDIAGLVDEANVYLIWLGDRIDDGLVYYTEQRLRKSSSKTVVLMVGKQIEDYYTYLDCANGFLLTSRQDPFPLVMIEAALLGKPIVAFPSGGVSEFIEVGMGLVTLDISVSQMVNAMRDIMTGATATNPLTSKARAEQFDLAEGYKQWLDVIEQAIDS